MMQDYSTSRRWRVLRLEILERDGYQCQVRGPHCKGKADQVDHIVPVNDGGAIYDPLNLRAACGWCNNWRAQRQKSRDGWRRSKTRIVVLMSPPGACEYLDAYLAEHTGPHDMVIDYRAIASAIGDNREEVKRVRASLLNKVRRGETSAARVFITSTNPRAEVMFPHHEVVRIDPGKEAVLAWAQENRPEVFVGLIDDWYSAREVPKAAAVREW